MRRALVMGWGCAWINQFSDSGRGIGRCTAAARYVSSRSGSRSGKLAVEKVKEEPVIAESGKKSVSVEKMCKVNEMASEKIAKPAVQKPAKKKVDAAVDGIPKKDQKGEVDAATKKVDEVPKKVQKKEVDSGAKKGVEVSKKEVQPKTRESKRQAKNTEEVSSTDKPVEKKPVKRTKSAEKKLEAKGTSAKVARKRVEVDVKDSAESKVHEQQLASAKLDKEALTNAQAVETKEYVTVSETSFVQAVEIKEKVAVQIPEQLHASTVPETSTQHDKTDKEAQLPNAQILNQPMIEGKVAVQQQKGEDGSVNPVEEADEDGVDEELKEFFKQRKVKKEEVAETKQEEEDVDVDYIWDYRNMKALPDSVNVLEKKLKQLVSTAPAHDRRIAVVKLKLALELIKESTERSVDLATDALKVFGLDDSLEQGTCLTVLGSGYRKLGQKERSLSLLRRASQYFEEKEEKGQEVLNEKQFVLKELGLTYLSLGRVKDAVESLVESLELLESVLKYGDPDLGTEYRVTADMLCEVEEWEEAKKLCEKAIRMHSKSKGYDNADVGQDRKTMAVIYTALNQHEEALEQYRTLKQIFSEDAGNVYLANMGIADSQIALKSYSEAIATLEGCLESAPKSARGSVYLKLAKVFFQKKNVDEAHKQLAACMNFYKENFEAGDVQEMADQLHEVADLFATTGDFVASTRALRIAIAAYDCVPGGEAMVVNAKLDMASHLISNGKAEYALNYCKEALGLSEKINKVTAKALTMTAAAHIKLSQHEAAIELLKRALDQPAEPESDRHPENDLVKASVYRHLVDCYRCLERYDEAIKHQRILVSRLQVLGDIAERELFEARRVLDELTEKVDSTGADQTQT